MWRLESEQGRWHTASFQFQIDLKRPDLGWTDIRLQQAAPSGDAPFQLRLPGNQGEEALSDCYVRQADLVATYTQRSDRSVRPQLLWRVLQDESRVGVETLVSMQTSLLDSEPEASVVHQLSGELWQLDERHASPCDPSRHSKPVTLLQRRDDLEQSLVILVHPTDFLSVETTPSDGGWRAEFTLFPDSLEKGVIRRARMRGIYVPRADDIDLARKCVEELVSAAPPLAT